MCFSYQISDHHKNIIKSNKRRKEIKNNWSNSAVGRTAVWRGKEWYVYMHHRETIKWLSHCETDYSMIPFHLASSSAAHWGVLCFFLTPSRSSRPEFTRGHLQRLPPSALALSFCHWQMIGNAEPVQSGCRSWQGGRRRRRQRKNSSIKSANGYNNDMLISLVAIAITILLLLLFLFLFAGLTAFLFV